MKKITTLLLFFSALAISFCQQKKNCEKPTEIIEDLNSISKCSVDKKKDSNKPFTVNISASKKRFLIKRNGSKKSFKKLVAKVDNISRKLSREEVKKALKFSKVTEVPAFANCTSKKPKAKKKCFTTEMSKHIEKHFAYPDQAVIKKIQGKVWVRFIIDKNGNIANIKTLGPKNGELLEEEAKRVTSLLSKFSPAKKGNKEVAVKFGFPINFSLND